MASIRAYEIQTYQGGKWKIDSIFDDRELALFEAGRMDESGRHPAIRVIEEDFDDKTQKTKIRTIYRGSKIEQGNAAALEKNKEVRQQVAQQKVQIAQDRVRKRTEAVRAEKRRKSNPFRLIGLFTAIAMLGLFAVFVLRYMYDRL